MYSTALLIIYFWVHSQHEHTCTIALLFFTPPLSPSPSEHLRPPRWWTPPFLSWKPTPSKPWSPSSPLWTSVPVCYGCCCGSCGPEWQNTSPDLRMWWAQTPPLTGLGYTEKGGGRRERKRERERLGEADTVTQPSPAQPSQCLCQPSGESGSPGCYLRKFGYVLLEKVCFSRHGEVLHTCLCIKV